MQPLNLRTTLATWLANGQSHQSEQTDGAVWTRQTVEDGRGGIAEEGWAAAELADLRFECRDGCEMGVWVLAVDWLMFGKRQASLVVLVN